MKPPLFIRPLTPAESQALRTGLGSSQGVTVRRCQILLASTKQQTPNTIAQAVHCSGQYVRNVIKAFHQEGLAAIQAKSKRPITVTPVIDQGKKEGFYHLLHQSPRTFGKGHSLWSLERVAEVVFEQGLTPRLVCDETIRRALRRFGINWKRAKHWINSPDPDYEAKKNAEIA